MTTSVKPEKMVKTNSNRNMIIANDGSAKFGPVYNVTKIGGMVEREIPIYVYISSGTLMKSENGKKNKQRICVLGDEMHVIGGYNGGKGVDVLIYKRSVGKVYKRKWDEIKGRFMFSSLTKIKYQVTAVGSFKDRTGCFRTEFGPNKEFSVWFSEIWWRKQNCDFSSSSSGFCSDECIPYYNPPPLF